ncbi:hypothetical protein AB2L28_05005 [Kineococcus sp. TBRC 1896]|uniref:Uncharacterized protein n=1 Tax=Kineococcus mangrovi TaxID=1660183 RepID=A0ABV4I1X1_9ACTN
MGDDALPVGVVGVVGSVAVSGPPRAEDHALVVEVLTPFRTTP